MRALASVSAFFSSSAFLASAWATSSSAIFWAVSRALRMASSVERYSSTLSTSTFILALRVAFSL